MKKKILVIVIYIALILITLKLIVSNIINYIFITDYNNKRYSEEQVKLLTVLNYPESYVANYNYGNILYQKQEYEKAIEKYSYALNSFIPKYKECKIRINYALSICKTVKLDEYNQEEIKKAIEKYESAINILTEKGCANIENNGGHSQDAETLKKDIQNEIERLKNLKNKSDENDKKDNNRDKKQEKKTTQTIEEKIQNIKEKATKKQREAEDNYKYYNKDLNMHERNW